MPRSRRASIGTSSFVGAALVGAGVTALALAACGTVLGLDDLDYPSARDGSSPGSPEASLDGSPVDIDGSSIDASSIDASSIDDAAASTHDVSVRFDGPTVLAQATTPQAIAVDDERLYWIEQNGASGGSVKSLAKDGTGDVTTIATGQPSPTDIAVDATHVYWSVSSPPPPGDGATSCLAMMASKAPDAGAPVCVTSSADATARMTITESDVVLLVNAPPSQFLGYATKDAGSTFLSTMTQGSAQAIAASDTKAFVGNVNGDHVDMLLLSTLAFGTNVCTANCGNAQSVDMAVDTNGENVLWVTSSGQVFTAAIVAANADGTILASLPNPAQRMARDGAYVYVTAPAGFVYAVPLFGADAGTFVTLASGQPAPYGVAVDANNVYWTGAGSIRATGVPPAP